MPEAHIGWNDESTDEEGLVMLQFHAQRTTSMHMPEVTKTETKKLFDEVKNKFERHYSPDGRQSQKKLSSSDISVDFELEPLCKLIPTPEVLLLRGKIDINHATSESLVLAQMPEQNVPLFPSVSKYFEIGLDGSERGTPKRQILQSVLEYGTVTMSPREALDSNVFDEMQVFTESVKKLKSGEKIPGGSAQIDRCFFESGIQCTHCGMQFTVGLEMANVEDLFKMSNSPDVVQVLEAVHQLCADESCSAEYKGLIILGSWTLKHVHSWPSCSHPKRSMRPWLVRTHFGDMYRAVKRLHGAAKMKDLKAHMLKASGLRADDVVVVNGLVDYLGFPEMAEILGYVMSRDPDYSAQMNATQPLPVTTHGLEKLAQQMLNNSSEINKALMARPCGVWGTNDLANNFTALDWLEGVENGKDLMSDADSTISKNSFSGLVWKSMGSWRMAHERDSRVFLECRDIVQCLSFLTPPFDSPAEAGKSVALAMADFEDRAKIVALAKADFEDRSKVAWKAH